MARRRAKISVEVNDKTFWVCRVCGDEVFWDDGLWRAKDLHNQYASNWICPLTVTNFDAWQDGTPHESLKLRPGFKDYYHHGQEIDPAADLQRIISEL